MEPESAVEILTKYEAELGEILGRFSRTRDGIHIHPDDDARVRQLVIELRDFLNDALGTNPYSGQIEQDFNEGVANFTGSPSYASVERIKGVVAAAISRVLRNPTLLQRPQDAGRVGEPGPEAPEKVTIRWLVGHVPVGLWAATISVLLAVFVLGVTAGQSPTLRGILEDLRIISKPSRQSEQLPLSPDELVQAYNKKVSKIQEAIIRLEEQASKTPFSSDRRAIEEAVERLRTDLKAAEAHFNEHLSALKALKQP